MNVFESVRGTRPRRSVFNLSYQKLMSFDLGQLMPIMCEEMVPGDYFKIGLEAVVRFLPMVVPVLHEIDLRAWWFFIPTRLLTDTQADWENFIFGGVDGADATVLPRWIPTHGNVTNMNGSVVPDNGVGSLWDAFGFPVTDAGIIPAGAYPLAFSRRSYNKVWNEWLRDETQQTAVDKDSSIILQVSWAKDYFASALPWQQRGTAPSLPISGTSAAVFSGNVPLYTALSTKEIFVSNGTTTPVANGTGAGVSDVLQARKANLDANVVNLGAATTFNVSDLRLAFAVQKFQEANARGGVRYTEGLQDHFGVSPRDDRLQRPEFIGGVRMPVQISEVLQTSATGTTPQANMAGHGLVAGREAVGGYHAVEFGYILGVAAVVPRAVYGQGIDRQWLRTSRYDFYMPEFAHLSEQAVLRAELYASNAQAENQTVFGYQGRYNEMRTKNAQVTGLMRYGVSGSLSFWHLSRYFASAPSLNSAFLACIPRKDYLAAPSQPAVIVNFGNLIKAVRPLPIESDPGLIDHTA